MRATAYCTAEAYNFSELLPLLQRNYLLLPFIADDVYHIRLVNPTEAPDAKPSDSSAHDVEAFIFQDGTFATWGATDAQNRALMQFLKQVEENSYKAPETEWFNYCIDMSQTGGLTADTIMIGNNGIPATQSRLAYSSGLARSVKLASLEEMLDQHLEKNKRIPQILLQGKKLPLSSAIVLQNLGELFLLRGHLNLHSELLDSPDFCWSSAKMEDIFERTSRNLDVRSRISIFNKKLDYANELTEVIRSHLHTQHSMGLEWAIVILIMIEVGFQVFHTYRDWDRPGHAAPSGDGVLSSLSSSVYSNTRHSSDGEFLPDDAVEEPASKASSKERKTRERERERDETHARKGAEREGGLRPASAY
ncbi:uncharacterized protein EV422DRAFT_499524 [Fimicolochytrium jonesii]|uniref:uncharacterized protein n=1 Tax=Fimicolochytrium jonesii TaxID=1396493 RepID=UPI0022FF0531|nr:uncharacterized protein EV422DRAFT_499524 [Fimicolochytrium jonesii]KAI8817962.1 hypothetical protein EV422DRAFT_499524 [Fimicolochytrium jonesii]